MNYLFWADGSPSIGLGHLSRQKMIARSLGERSDASTILLTGATAAVIAPFEVGFHSIQPVPPQFDTTKQIELVSDFSQKTDASILIIDKPEYPAGLCKGLFCLREACPKLAIAAFDAAAMPPGCVDLIIDANQRPAIGERFRGSVTRALLGPDYAVVEPAFVDARSQFQIRRRLERVLISMGGSDPNFVTSLALEAALTLERTRIDVVLGPSFAAESLLRLKAMLHDPRVAVHRDKTQQALASLMVASDACIISAGLTMFEVATVGIPALVISQNEKQVANAAHLAECGAVLNLGLFSDISAEVAAQALADWESSIDARAKLSEAAMNAVDGKGIDRIRSAILSLIRNAE